VREHQPSQKQEHQARQGPAQELKKIGVAPFEVRFMFPPSAHSRESLLPAEHQDALPHGAAVSDDLELDRNGVELLERDAGPAGDT